MFVKFTAYKLFLLPSSHQIEKNICMAGLDWFYLQRQFEQQMYQQCYMDWLNSKSEQEKKESRSNIFLFIESWSKIWGKNYTRAQGLFQTNLLIWTNIILNLCYIQSEFSKICMVQMEPFSVFMPFWYSASRPFLVSRRVLHALLSPSLFVLSKSACVPLKTPLLPCLWCESQRRQWVLTCQLSWPPEGWLCAGVC